MKNAIKNIKNNITMSDFILLPFTTLNRYFHDLFILKNICKNWLEVMLFRFGFKKKCIAKLRNGDVLKLENFGDYLNIWREGHLPQECFKWINNKEGIKFKYKNYPGDLYLLGGYAAVFREIFVEESYKLLNVSGKEVVDIGANIGDTAIYFVVNGAKHVYAFEPYPFSYKIALKNVALNKFEKKVTVLNEAIGGSNRSIFIDENYENTVGDDLKEFKKGKKIKVITLEEVVKRFNLKDAVLKVDCEGCEYCAIINTPNEILRKFKEIMIEYHYGYLDLKEKLEEAGFVVKVSSPRYSLNVCSENSSMVVGYLYARRVD